METVSCLDLAEKVLNRHFALHDIDHYTGIVSLHAAARLAVSSGNPAHLALIREKLQPFLQEQCYPEGKQCSYKNYRCGGNATAFLLFQKLLPESENNVRRYAEELLHEAPRDPQSGIYSMPMRSNRHIWIDSVFAVTPFLLFAGLALGSDAYIEEAFQQAKKMLDIFRDPEAGGIMHQSRDFAGFGIFSQDHWSRGNGWGLYGSTELINYLPENHARRPEAEKLFRDHLLGCIRYQDNDGMWHQEITDHSSYVETSGTGLILYALGTGLEKGIIKPEYMENFRRGLRGYLSYIAQDGSLFHCCRGCLCPGNGSIEAYKNVPWVMNDCHAFGPAAFTFVQAYRLGIDSLSI